MEMIACGSIKLGKSSTPHPERLKRLYKRLWSLIEEFKPDEMALEAPFYGKNPQSMLKLGRAQGVAMAAAMTMGVDVHVEYTSIATCYLFYCISALAKILCFG